LVPYLIPLFFSRPKTKKPHEIRRACRDSLSREEFRFCSREGSLAYGSFAGGEEADYSGGTAADSHGLPRFSAYIPAAIVSQPVFYCEV